MSLLYLRWQRWCHLMWHLLCLDLSPPHCAIDAWDDKGRPVLIGCTCGKIWEPKTHGTDSSEADENHHSP